MQLNFKVDRDIIQKLETWSSNVLPQKREQLVQQSMQSTLNDIVNHTPVETGRTQHAWSEALSGLQDAAPGTDQAEGSATLQRDQDTTEATATNSVPYISYLEYGTSNMSPFATVRNALLNLRRTINSFFSI